VDQPHVITNPNSVIDSVLGSLVLHTVARPWVRVSRRSCQSGARVAMLVSTAFGITSSVLQPDWLDVCTVSILTAGLYWTVKTSYQIDRYVDTDSIDNATVQLPLRWTQVLLRWRPLLFTLAIFQLASAVISPWIYPTIHGVVMVSVTTVVYDAMLIVAWALLTCFVPRPPRSRVWQWITSLVARPSLIPIPVQK
jgi:hypothetical protein